MPTGRSLHAPRARRRRPRPSRRDAGARRPSRPDPLQRLRGHLALARVRQELRRLLERQPARLRDLDAHRLLDLADPPATRAQEEEAHDLEDPLAALPGRRVDVADVAELLDQPPLDTG